MIGYYNRSVILTYIGLLSAMTGMLLAIGGYVIPPVILLLVSGVCDMFDGKIARATERTAPAKHFGIEIDSLCDLVCFGVYPAVMVYCFGAKSVVSMIVLALYALCAVIRLGYYNVDEFQRQKGTSANRDYYQGMPVTTVAWTFPFISLVKLAGDSAFAIFGTIFMGVLALFFILDIKVKKPHI